TIHEAIPPMTMGATMKSVQPYVPARSMTVPPAAMRTKRRRPNKSRERSVMNLPPHGVERVQNQFRAAAAWSQVNFELVQKMGRYSTSDFRWRYTSDTGRPTTLK